jgi:hypothetical protein
MTTITLRTPTPHQAFWLDQTTVRSDGAGLITAEAGSEIAKYLISYGCTVVAPLQTTDPGIAGVAWNNAGVITISAG